MAYVFAFSVSSLLGRPSVIVFNNNSTGDLDPNIVEFHIFLLQSDGDYLRQPGSITNYIVWPLSSNPFLLDILLKDMALSITVEADDGNVGFLLINATDSLLINSTDKILL